MQIFLRLQNDSSHHFRKAFLCLVFSRLNLLLILHLVFEMSLFRHPYYFYIPFCLSLSPSLIPFGIRFCIVFIFCCVGFALFILLVPTVFMLARLCFFVNSSYAYFFAKCQNNRWKIRLQNLQKYYAPLHCTIHYYAFNDIFRSKKHNCMSETKKTLPAGEFLAKGRVFLAFRMYGYAFSSEIVVLLPSIFTISS